MGAGDVGSMAAGAGVVAALVQAIRATGKVGPAWLPLISLGCGIAWGLMITVSGGFDSNLVTGVLAGILTGASASGAQSWSSTTATAIKDRSSGGQP